MNVLSLFDGISCGQLALQRAGIAYDTYYASEIDKHAISVTQRHFPNTVQLGDIVRWQTWDLPKIDLIIGGSPCQGFSYAGKQLNFDDPRSALFFTFLEVLRAVKPRYFLLENVVMSKKSLETITELLGVAPIKINSELVSAQHRPRFYWTNIPNVCQPEDRGILLSDILDYNEPSMTDERFNRISAWVRYGTSKRLSTSRKSCTVMPGQSNNDLLIDLRRFYSILELERLQTLPDGYTEGIAKTHRSKAIGNGWTVDVIAHIFSFLPKEFLNTSCVS